ncbi:12651_t:CDS:1, partial [Gigaspora margarita]
MVEIDALIKDAPIKKATGPSQISNEMLTNKNPEIYCRFDRRNFQRPKKL